MYVGKEIWILWAHKFYVWINRLSDNLQIFCVEYLEFRVISQEHKNLTKILELLKTTGFQFHGDSTFPS